MADFTAIPDFTLEEERQNNTIISDFENGAEQRRQKWTSLRRKWKLVFRNRIASERDEVRDFHDGKNGSLTAFTWEIPATESEAAQEVTVRFGDDVFKSNRNRYNNFDFDISLIEVL